MIYKGSFGYLEERFVEEVAGLKKGDPLAPVTVLAGSNLARIYLQRRLAEAAGSHINVRFLTIKDLARTVAESSLLASEAQPLTPEGQSALCRDIIRELSETSYFHPLVEFPGFPKSLAATFNDLDEAGISGIPKGRGSNPKLRDLARLYEHYRAGLAGRFYTAASLMFQAASVAPGGMASHELIVFGVYDLNPAQQAVLESLAPHCRLTFMIPDGYAENAALTEGMRLFAERLTGDPADTPGAHDEPGEGRGHGDLSREDTRILSAPDPESEVRETLREILDFVAGGGYFADVCILLRDPSYATLYADTMELLGIPYFSAFGRPLARSAEARSILMLLDLLSREMDRFAVLGFLDFAPLDLAKLEKAGYEHVPALWDVISREAGIVRGFDQWSAGLRSCISALDRRAARRQDDGAMHERLNAARGLEYIVREIERQAGRIPAESSWRGYIDAVCSTARSLLAPSDELEALLESIEDLAYLDELAPRVSRTDFTRTLRELWERKTTPCGRFRNSGVNVCDLMSARGISFDMVVIPGLVSGSFPQNARQDPLLLDGERRLINDALGAEVLAPKGRDNGEDELLFNMSMGAARQRLLLSYPRAEGAGQRERVPSPFLLRMAETLAGETLGYAGIHKTPGFQRIPAAAAPSCGAGSILSGSEYDRCMARASVRSKGTAADFPLSCRSPFWQRRILAEAARKSHTLTPFELVESSPFPGWAGEGVIAVTRLENYARCPFGYFLKHVLGVEPLEEPADTLTISPSDRGSLMHAVLANLYAELAARSMLPLSKESMDSVLAMLHEQMEEELERREGALMTGLPVLWKLERARMERELRIFLAREASAGADSPEVPRFFELAFGLEREGVENELPALEIDLGFRRAIAFRGKIDRVDISAGGESLRVLDYKSGGRKETPDSFKGGEQLQMPLYMLAALSIPGVVMPERLEARYVYLSERADKAFVPFTAASAEELRGSLAELLHALTQHMEAGYFFVNPDENKCKFCDFRIACTPERRSLFAGKAGDPLVLSWKELQDV